MIQVYTGSGKGKTTAALGLALRAAGANRKVYFCQFLKSQPTAELAALKAVKNIRVGRFGTRTFVGSVPTSRQRACVRKGLAAARTAIMGRRYDMVILDEINVVLKLKLLPVEDILSLIHTTPAEVELVLTGRACHPEIIKCAHLVSDIKEKKHYFRQGIAARRGIEY